MPADSFSIDNRDYFFIYPESEVGDATVFVYDKGSGVPIKELTLPAGVLLRVAAKIQMSRSEQTV
jgi:hypothetical protein